MNGSKLERWAVAGLVILAVLVTTPRSVFAQSVTYAEHIAPILQENCQVCHRPGTVAPMSLLTYEDARLWAPMIREKVASRLMPPWPLDQTVGIQEFKNDASLSEEEIETIVQWADAGAPLGDPAAMPPPVEFPDYIGSWKLEAEYGRPPDVIVESEPYTVMANGQDQWWSSEVEVEGLEQKRWVRAVEIRPGNQETGYVFHHANSQLRQNGESWRLAGAAVGTEYEVLPNDEGQPIGPGAKVGFGMHFFPIGQEVEDAVLKLGLWFYPEGEEPRFQTIGQRTGFRADAVTNPAVGLQRGNDLVIPPHGTLMLQGTIVLQQPARIRNVRGHMHLRGKYQTIEAIFPDGRREILSKLNWQHKWHTSFHYADHVMPLLPKGTVLILTSWFDNTENNPTNPDPRQWVVWGKRSVDEMSHMHIGITYFEQEDFDELVAEREQLLRQMHREELVQTQGQPK